MPPSPPAQSSSGFACSTCGRQYQHSSHLRRHEATHRGSDEFKCQYCGRVFGRRDVWRKHYTSCPQNNNHDEPPPAKRGKKPRACDACYRSKVSCDGVSPCARCTTRQAPCTYSRVQVLDVPDAPLPSPGFAVETPPSMITGDSPATLPTPSFHKAEHTKIPVSFLLSLTNPEADSMVRAFLQEPCRDADVPGTLLMPDAGIPADELQEAAPVDELLFPWLYGDMYPDLWSDPNSLHLPQLGGPKPEAIDPTLAPIVSELEFLHHTLIASDPSYGDTFDPVLARKVFVTSNCDAFAALYFQHTHKHLPLIHRPSFSTSRSSPALVLAILLCGAVYAPPRDTVLAIPRFFRIAEQYIFGRLESQLKLARGGLEDAVVDTISLREDMELEMYETLQAAMLIQGAQFMMNSPGARSRAWVVRKGGLVDAIRLLGLTKARHSQEVGGGAVDWATWVKEEIRIRIAIWTILSDWQHSGVTHTPWHMTIHEMTGDTPCLQELWEARNQAEFEAVVAAKGRDCWRRSASLRDCMDAFMADPWSGFAGFPLRNVTMLDLHIFISGIHVMIGCARLLSMLPASIPTFQRATDRWEEMWRETVSQFDEEELRMCGMVRHAGEFCWLAKAMLKYALEGKDKTSPYYQRIGHKSLKELHNLLRELRELSV